MEFLRAFGIAFGLLAGAGVIGLVFKVGLTWGAVSRDIATTKQTVERTEVTVQDVVPRVQRIEQTLHGPDGNNGLYGDVKDLRRRFEDNPAISKRRKTDKRKALVRA